MTLVLDLPDEGLAVSDYQDKGRQVRDAQRSLIGFAAWTMPWWEPAEHLRKLAEYLEAVECGEIRRLMIWMPPQHGKSTLTSILFPAWCLARNPRRRLILASYGDLLVTSLSRAARNLLAEPNVAVPFSVSLAQDTAAANYWSTSAGGRLLATTVGGGITGHGADLLIIDDPIKSREEAYSQIQRDRVWQWWSSDAYTRLSPTGAVAIIQTRSHEDDLSGRILASSGPGDWEVLRLPALAEDGDLLGRRPGAALWPERFPVEVLEDRRTVLGALEFASLYQQRPRPLEGAIFKWWPRYDKLPDKLDGIAIGIDTAYTASAGSDYTAYAAWGAAGGNLYLIEAGRLRGEVPTVEKALHAFILRITQDYKMVPLRVLVRASVAIDRIAAQHLRAKGIAAVEVKMPQGKTAEIASMIAPEFEAGRALIPQRAPWWLDEWLAEHAACPTGLHDDWVETTNLCLWYFTRGQREVKPFKAQFHQYRYR